MKITIGTPATKDNFYPRSREVDRIYRSLADGNNIYLSAPRRVGKTSIMKHLQNNPQPGHFFIYGDYEACKTVGEFFLRLIANILESSVKLNWGQKTLTKIKEVSKHFESFNFEAYGFKAEVKAKIEVDWIGNLQGLLKEIKIDKARLVIMIDEFPQVVLNILDNESEAAAANFLFIHRQLRQHLEANHDLSFIYTGSVSLNHAVLKAGDLKTVNDFDFVTVEPLEREQALAMAALILKEYKIPLTGGLLATLIDRIEWLIPYHIQLILKEIREMNHETEVSDPAAVIDRAFENLLHLQNKPQFDHYFSRLQKVFHDKERKFAFKALQMAANSPAPHYSMLVDAANKCGCIDRCADILEALEIDGYLMRNHRESTYHFRSPILKAWWNRHESQKHQ